MLKLTLAAALGILILGLIQPFTQLFMADASTQAGKSNGTTIQNESTYTKSTNTVANSNVTNSTRFLTYHNPDFGISIQYPSNWTIQEDNLRLHTIAAFSAIHENKYAFINSTWAEVDLRVYNAPQNETSVKLNIGQRDTQGQVVISQHKNSTTTLGGLQSLIITDYSFGDVPQKQMQVWTFIPGKHILAEIIYTALPSKYSFYLPVVARMIDSVEILH